MFTYVNVGIENIKLKHVFVYKVIIFYYETFICLFKFYVFYDLLLAQFKIIKILHSCKQIIFFYCNKCLGHHYF